MPTINTGESTITYTDPLANVFDSDWLTDAFIVDLKKLDEEARVNIFSSFSDRMLTDTSIGGSLTINPEYQFTRYADIPRMGRRFDRTKGFGPADFKIENDKVSGWNIGVGRCYGDYIDVNREILVLEFGVPEFISMLSFYARSADYQKSVIAKEGRDTKWYTVGEVIGVLGQIVTLNVNVALVYAGIFGLKAFVGNGDTRYYHFKPNMPDYWASVSAIHNYLATERGILLPGITPSDAENKLGLPLKVDGNLLAPLKETLPAIFSETNYIDVFAISQRAQVEVNRQLMRETIAFNSTRLIKSQVDGVLNEATGQLDREVNYEAYLKAIKDKSEFFYSKKTQAEEDLPKAESASSGDLVDYLKPDNLWRYLKFPFELAEETVKEYAEATMSTIKDGGQTLMLTVEYVNPSDFSASNEFKDIPAKSKFVELGGAARDLRFSTSGGNIFGYTVKKMQDGIKDVVAGTLDQVTFGLSNVIMALTNGGYMNFPKMWSDSNVNLPEQSFKIVATPPYGNVISKSMDIDLVLSSLLAGTLPQGVGQNVYQSPRLCRAFLRGKLNIDFGMISSITIKKAVNNIAFSKDGKTLGIEIIFTIKDFSEYFAAPVKQSLLGAFGIGLDDNNALNKYLSTFAGRDYHTTRYAFRNGLLQTSRAVMGVKALTSPSYLGMLTGDSLLGKTFGTLTGAIFDTSGLYLRS